jgi:hypothetical protein
VGTVLHYDAVKKRMLVGVRNHLVAGDEVELLLPDDTVPIDTRILVDTNGNQLNEANNDNQIYLLLEQEVPIGAVLRQRVK